MTSPKKHFLATPLLALFPHDERGVSLRLAIASAFLQEASARTVLREKEESSHMVSVRGSDLTARLTCGHLGHSDYGKRELSVCAVSCELCLSACISLSFGIRVSPNPSRSIRWIVPIHPQALASASRACVSPNPSRSIRWIVLIHPQVLALLALREHASSQIHLDPSDGSS